VKRDLTSQETHLVSGGHNGRDTSGHSPGRTYGTGPGGLGPDRGGGGSGRYNGLEITIPEPADENSWFPGNYGLELLYGNGTPPQTPAAPLNYSNPDESSGNQY
jgi:hypothetical protein